MRVRNLVFTCSALFLFTACGQQAEDSTAASEPEDAASAAPAMSEEAATAAPAMPEEAATAAPAMPEEAATAAPAMPEEAKLQIEIIKNGYGRAAEAGDYVTVHYTGWLYDESAPDNRGDKFDSSVDRGDKFQFPLGAGQVIKGWDEGVSGMLIGEKRVLTIPPSMGYGDRGAGNDIPPGATLVFEVELFGAEAPGE